MVEGHTPLAVSCDSVRAFFVAEMNAVALVSDKDGEALAGPHFERQVVHLHRLGPRAVAEILIEIAHCTGQSGVIADRLQAYGRLDPAVLRFLGGNSFPPMPLTVIR